MKMSLVVWGLILIIGFYASDWLLLQGYNASWLWIAWAVIFNVGHFALGKSMKKSSKSMQAVWMHIGIFGLITTVVIALGIVSLSLAFLMAFWLLLIGAALFAGGHEGKDSLSVCSGLILIIGAIFTPAFGNSYFLAGSLLLGLLMLLHGIWLKN